MSDYSQVIQAMFFFIPKGLEVTFPTFDWKGHVNSPSHKWSQLQNCQGLSFLHFSFSYGD